jgi:hypothetical protein
MAGIFVNFLLIWTLIFGALPQNPGPSVTGALAASGGGVTWTLIQHVHNWTCTSKSSGNLTCTVTASSTVSGDGLLLALSYYEAITSTATGPSFVSASGDSTWTHNAGCSNYMHNNTNTSFEGVDCAYIASATGGATSLSMVYNFANVDGSDAVYADLELYEVRRSSGSASLDVLNSTVSNCTSCTGPTLAITGTDYVAEWAAACNPPGVPGSPWTNPSDVDSTNNQIAGFLGALNQTSVSALTYTQSPTCGFAAGAFGFK